ncbi:MAG: hypothetical protein C7B45_07185 [Sulfobacillus acidophilus]|uniref:HTH cro/C1-type domain-containing protein n=1 Tax=Sulfobacillus acidophilus TaxID=53633 RepID=A0A2T2WJ66_9FIRM|nr:MAG: hypothetical protein C7B45_07185 [Sulfobacillus acidophilus]
MMHLHQSCLLGKRCFAITVYYNAYSISKHAKKGRRWSMDSDKNAIGDRIRRLRRRHDLTQRQLAARLGVAGSTVANWEVGSSPLSSQSIKKVATFFGVSERWLETGEGSSNDSEIIETRWPFEALRRQWGVNAQFLPAEWPDRFQEYVSLAVQFGLNPQEATFRAMVAKAQELGTDTPLPLALTAPDSPRKRQLADWILLGTDAALDIVEDARRKAQRKE